MASFLKACNLASWGSHGKDFGSHDITAIKHNGIITKDKVLYFFKI